MRLEGGFQGRTNKLVDACYSFWQGGAFLFLHNILFRESKLKVIFTQDYLFMENNQVILLFVKLFLDKAVVNADKWLFNQEALQEYILMCCQLASGGLIDKPGK